VFQIHSWPNVILHLDGDAFFASVAQAINPLLRDKPVVTGKERGIATAISYQAKKYGIRRGMTIQQMKKICPNLILVESDYETYSLFSQKMFGILRSFTPLVEEYSIDEAFADIKGLRRPLNKSYEEIGQAIKNKIESSLGITVSVGISLNKSLAKLASNSQKPSGLTMIKGSEIESFLSKIPVNDIWGVGENTTAYLNKLGIKTALEFALKEENFVLQNLTKPFWEIWRELRGQMVYDLNYYGKNEYKSITRSQTFYPPTNGKNFLLSKIFSHVEEAFSKLRHLNYLTGKIIVFLKTQQFSYQVAEVKIQEKTSFPLLIREEIKQAFQKIYKKNLLYRTAGCTLTDFENNQLVQTSLFNDKQSLEQKAKKIYSLIEEKKIDFGTILFQKNEEKPSKDHIKFKVPFISV
jgi:DNA polymerase-4/DNA polymerase V